METIVYLVRQRRRPLSPDYGRVWHLEWLSVYHTGPGNGVLVCGETHSGSCGYLQSSGKEKITFCNYHI